MTNSSFQHVVRPHHLDWSVFYRHIHLNEVMSAAIDQFVSRFFGAEMVGVHYRGTDKYPANGDLEDVGDGHMRYDIMISAVDKYSGRSSAGTYGRKCRRSKAPGRLLVTFNANSLRSLINGSSKFTIRAI